MLDEIEDTWPFGRCDTCGAPCDGEGCTVNPEHEIAVA